MAGYRDYEAEERERERAAARRERIRCGLLKRIQAEGLEEVLTDIVIDLGVMHAYRYDKEQ